MGKIHERVIGGLGALTARSGFADFEQTICGLIDETGAVSIMEIGAGRSPLLYGAAQSRNLTYIANDIDEHELKLADPAVPHCVFDIGGMLPKLEPVDMIVSRSVLEHVADVDSAVLNSFELLRPGGYAFHFIPTLYSLPFLVNRLLPESLALKLLRIVKPRDERVAPKFPAHYHRCNSRMANVEHLDGLLQGGRVDIVPYFGHQYYSRVPGLASLAPQWHRFLERRQFRPLSAFAWLVISRPTEEFGGSS